ncbi:MAG: hypothetical protein HKN91_05400 [Acidimicrobiia bacterium]|nr:hypothetical protein [Acidimicrobiia bacterium]
MDERRLQAWVRYGRIVDSVATDADEREIIGTFHAICDGRPLPELTDPRLVEAARTAIEDMSSVL